MLFDPRPKSDPESFFDRGRELSEFIEYLKSTPLILVLGLRRYGKTSLVLTGLNLSGCKYVYIDCRRLPSTMFGPKDLAEVLSNAISRFMERYKPLASTIAKLLSMIRGVKVYGLEVRVDLRKFRSWNITDFFDALDSLGERIVVVFDEAQELRRMAKYRFDYILGYVYDNLKNLTIVLTGSQIGLLYKLLRVNDPESPLYGRPRAEIRLGKLSKELSKEFLVRGFREYNLDPDPSILDYIIERVDGIIGWLAYIGHRMASMKRLDKRIVDEVVDEASKLVLSELKHFLETRGVARRRYLAMLEAIARLDEPTWSRVLGYTIARIGRIPVNTFNTMLQNLIDAGFIVKEKRMYKIADPILEYALKKYTLT